MERRIEMKKYKEVTPEELEKMTEAEALQAFDREWEEFSKKYPKGLLYEEPRFQITGEIIPPSLRGDNKDMSYSELP